MVETLIKSYWPYYLISGEVSFFFDILFVHTLPCQKWIWVIYFGVAAKFCGAEKCESIRKKREENRRKGGKILAHFTLELLLKLTLDQLNLAPCQRRENENKFSNGKFYPWLRRTTKKKHPRKNNNQNCFSCMEDGEKKTIEANEYARRNLFGCYVFWKKGLNRCADSKTN